MPFNSSTTSGTQSGNAWSAPDTIGFAPAVPSTALTQHQLEMYERLVAQMSSTAQRQRAAQMYGVDVADTPKQDDVFRREIEQRIHEGLKVGAGDAERYARIIRKRRHINRNERQTFHHPRPDGPKTTDSISVDDIVP